MGADQEIQTLAQTLGLADAPQDWGVINSDPGRVEEFIQFCETAALTPAQQFAMTELVFASTNDALADGDATAGVVDSFEGFLASGLQGLPWHVRYWSSLDDEDEFPIGTLLRRLATHA